jgi:hypothetical protein
LLRSSDRTGIPGHPTAGFLQVPVYTRRLPETRPASFPDTER